MKNAVIYTLLIVVIVALVVFNVVTVRRVSMRPPPAGPPELNEAPVRVYGIVEPAGKEIAVSPRAPGIVEELLVDEGDTVTAGDPLCRLDDEVLRAELAAAEARVALARTAAALSRDEFRRNESLLADGTISESTFTRLKLRMELDEREVALAGRQVELARARIADLAVRAPRNGIVYLCDIRPGEFFAPGDGERIVIGAASLQVRCDVEVLWIDRLAAEATYTVLNAETGEPVGTARFDRSSRYLRPKRITTEEPGERMSARYQEVVMSFEPADPGIPVRLPVMVALEPPDAPAP